MTPSEQSTSLSKWHWTSGNVLALAVAAFVAGAEEVMIFRPIPSDPKLLYNVIMLLSMIVTIALLLIDARKSARKAS